VCVSKVGGIFVHKREAGRFAEKSTFVIREAVMQEKHSVAQDVIQQLTAELGELAAEELQEMVRLLQEATPASLFGQTEFKIRALAHRIAAKAYQQRLEQKKTATTAPASPARTASKPPATT
jgi:hypothetical protein